MTDAVHLLHDGSLGASLALWALADRGDRAVVIHMAPPGATARIEHDCEVCGAKLLRVEAASEGITHLLLRAGARCGSGSRLVWPIQCGGDGLDEVDLGAIGDAVERASAVTRLLALDGVDVRLETPYVDLSDRQLCELALDLDVAVTGLWWWTDQSPEGRALDARWGDVFEACGCALQEPRATT